MTTYNLKLAIIAFTFIAGVAGAKEGPAQDGPDPVGFSVTGSLDKQLIRNVIRDHIREIKRCYQVELDKNESLQGRVQVNFTIGSDGKVTKSTLEQTTLGSPSAEKCIVNAVRSWQFPMPKSEPVVVTYPFILKHT